jgi:hypothetical protein
VRGSRGEARFHKYVVCIQNALDDDDEKRFGITGSITVDVGRTSSDALASLQTESENDLPGP